MNAVMPASLEPQFAPQQTTEPTNVPPLVAYWNVLRRRKWLIAAIVVLALILGTLLSMLATP